MSEPEPTPPQMSNTDPLPQTSDSLFVNNSYGTGGIVPTTIPIPPVTAGTGALQLSLISMDKMVRIDTLGTLSSTPYNPEFEKWNAVAQCNVPLEVIRSMFVFQTDHFDVDDVAATDVRFYIDSANIPTQSQIGLPTAVVGNGKVSSLDAAGAVLSNDALVVGKDYIRHLANKLFNTPFGVDLFINEQDLVASVNEALNKIWLSCASDLENNSIIGDTMSNTYLQGATGHKYQLSGERGSGNNFNFGCELFKMLISRAPSRFTNLETLAVDSVQATRVDPAARNLYKLPLNVGDQILIRVGLKPHPEQSSFQNSTKDQEIQNDLRVYVMVLNLV